MSGSERIVTTQRADAAKLSSLELGDVTITYLPDGIHHVEAPTHYPLSADTLWDEHPEVLDEDGLLVMSIGSILIQTPTNNVLVDVGFGRASVDIGELTGGVFRGDIIGGELLESLDRVGLTPSDIDSIIFTHLHVDHVGWLIDPDDDSRPTFPNAKHYMHAAELEYWTHEEDAVLRGKGASPEQLAIVAREQTLISQEAEIVPGVTIVPTTGHTPGHISVLVASGEEQVLILGDALHCPVELQHDGMAFVFDLDSEDAEASRVKIRKLLADPKTYFAGGHFPDRIFGKVVDGGRRCALEYVDESGRR